MFRCQLQASRVSELEPEPGCVSEEFDPDLFRLTLIVGVGGAICVTGWSLIFQYSNIFVTSGTAEKMGSVVGVVLVERLPGRANGGASEITVDSWFSGAFGTSFSIVWVDIIVISCSHRIHQGQ